MSPGLLTTLAAATMLVVVLAVLLTRALSGRRRLEDSLAASREELAAVQRRLDVLSHQVELRSSPRPVPGERDDPLDDAEGEADYVITTAGEHPRAPVPARVEPAHPLTARQFASVALGESLVTVFSFGYGVRRALSAENRNRIGFEMRREVRRSRKERRRELKEARRRLREPADPYREDAA